MPDAENNPEPEVSIEDLQAKMSEMEKLYQTTLAQNESLTQENQKVKEKQQAADKYRRQQEKEAQKAMEEAARKSGDVEALEKSWNEKYSSLESSNNETISSLNKIINDVTVKATAQSLASSIAIDEHAAKILSRFIEQDLSMEIVNGEAVVKVLQNGKPSALTIDDLKLKISEDPMFAREVKGSAASGAGPAGNSSGGGSGSNKMKRDQFESMNPVEKQRFFKEGGKLVD